MELCYSNYLDALRHAVRLGLDSGCVVRRGYCRWFVVRPQVAKFAGAGESCQ